MLPFPEKLPTIDQVFLKTEGRYHLTQVAKEAWGPLLAEAGIDIRRIRTPAEFQQADRQLVNWRRTQHAIQFEKEDRLLATDDPRRKATQALLHGTPQAFKAALLEDDRYQAVKARRKGMSVVFSAEKGAKSGA